MSPSAAIDLWTSKIPALKAQFPNIKIVGPACASDPAGQAWITEFLGLLKGKGGVVDFLGVHWYGEDHEEAKRFLEGWKEKCGGIGDGVKVVVSEIACTSREYSAVKTFNAELCNCKCSQLDLHDGFAYRRDSGQRFGIDNVHRDGQSRLDIRIWIFWLYEKCSGWLC